MGQSSAVPAWLQAHVGDRDGQIARAVLERARALYLKKVREGAVRSLCYFAMDATRPNYASEGILGRRFYIICEADRSFRAISAGHGSGHDLKGIVDFANGRRCAKNFSNAIDSNLTTGGAYVTAETKHLSKDITAFRQGKTLLWYALSFSLTAKARPQMPGSARSADMQPFR
ncbi:hypothetical protein V1273_002760 [Bradyrhizobium sp. AZCC 1721]